MKATLAGAREVLVTENVWLSQYHRQCRDKASATEQTATNREMVATPTVHVESEKQRTQTAWDLLPDKGSAL